MARRFSIISGLVLILSVFSIWDSGRAQVVSPGPIMRTIAGGGTTGGGLPIFDDFNRADSATLGGNWTEAKGDTAIFSNTARLVTGGFVDNLNVNSTSLGAVNGYSKITIIAQTVGLDFPCFIFRYTDSSSPFYILSWDLSAGCSWQRFANVAGSGVEIAAGDAGNISVGQSIGITWTGTGTGTEIRIWTNPTAAAPTSVSSWDGGSDPADLTFTTDPGTPVDTGQLVGFGGQQNTADTVRLDDFRANAL